MIEQEYFTIMFGDGDEAVDLGKMLENITDISRNIGPGWDNIYSSGTSRYGKTWVRSTLNAKAIKIKFTLTGDSWSFEHKRRTIASILDCPNGPKKLTFDDQRNFYYLAVPNGLPTFEEDLKTSTATGEIEFTIPDGVQHSEVYKYLTESTDNENIGSITKDGTTVTLKFNNEGSIECHPVIKVTNNQNNGWLGFVNKEGIMEVGYNPSSVEGQAVATGDVTSEVLLSINPSNNAAWATSFTNNSQSWDAGGIPFLSDYEIGTGTIGFRQKGVGGLGYDCPGFAYNGDGNLPVSKNWAGVVYEHTLKADANGETGAKNWRCDFNMKVWSAFIGQTGALTISFLTADNKHICSYGIEDYETTNLKAYAVFSTTNVNSNASTTTVRTGFDANNNESGSRDRNVSFNQYSGDAYIIKDGSKFTFTYNGVPQTKTFSDKENLVCAKIMITAGRWKMERKDVGKLNTLTLQSIKFTKSNVERYDRTPNKYVANSQVILDLHEGEVRYVADPTVSKQGVKAQEDIVDGSDYFFSVPKGVSELKIMSSTFVSSPPTVEAEWYESYL